MGKIVYSKTKNIMIFLILKVWVGLTPQSIPDPDPPQSVFDTSPKHKTTSISETRHSFTPTTHVFTRLDLYL